MSQQFNHDLRERVIKDREDQRDPGDATKHGDTDDRLP